MTRARPVRDLLLAVSTLTLLPTRVRWPEGERTDAPGYYPLVGVVVGVLGAGLVRALESTLSGEHADLVLAALLVALWSLVTRMLHWDGLADVADGFWAHSRQRRLEIMSDSAIGAFGACALSLSVVLQVAALAAIVQAHATWTIIAVPGLSRLAAVFGAWFGTAAKPDGLGASVVGRPELGAIVPAVLTMAPLAVGCYALVGVAGLELAIAGVILAAAVPHLLAMRFGGVTGDVLGASVALVETLLLVSVALWFVP